MTKFFPNKDIGILTVPYRYNLAAVSALIKHPTHVTLPATGEYTANAGYKLSAPVARLTVQDRANSGVAPGIDAGMCLSCHVTQTSNYPDMLLWDYSTMISGNGGTASGTRYLACHTIKD